jgi:hypothetical protein
MAQPVDDAAKAELDAKAAVFEERYYLNNADVKTELKGIEAVEGKDAYKIAITMPGGTPFHAFYDVATGLKVQEVKEQEGGPMGKMTITTRILEYKENAGLKFPAKMTVDFGAFKQNVSITEVKVNQGLTVDKL